MKSIIAGTVAVLISSSAFASVWQETRRSPEQTKTLKQVEQFVKTTKNPVVIFDLDATLYDDRGRSVAIIKEYAKKHNLTDFDTLENKHISAFSMDQYLIETYKMDPKRVAEIIPGLKTYWAKRFFSGKYQRKFDRPMPGAIDYVNALYKRGAYIAYVTGRNEATMGADTLARLKEDGFPIDKPRTVLMMQSKDAIAARRAAKNKHFKTVAEYNLAIAKIDRASKAKKVAKLSALGTVVAFFENTPGHMNVYFDAFHRENQNLAVFLDTYAPPNSPAIDPLVRRIYGFLQ